MNDNHYFLYYFFDNPFIRWLRVLLFFLIGIVVYLNLGNMEFIIRILPLYFFLILQEFFIHFKLENSLPKKKITDDFNHIIECVDFRTRVLLERHKDMESVIRNIEHFSEVKLFKRLLNLEKIPLENEIPEKDVLEKVRSVVGMVKGTYVHALDIFTAYILLSDAQNKFLFNQELFEKDVVTILAWVRREYRVDRPHHYHLSFTGSGVFDFFIFGWSTQIARVAANFTSEALMKKHSEPIARESEYDLLVTALSKSSSSNVLLIGPAGVGKTALVTQFAIDSNQGALPNVVSNKIVFQLYPERLISGVENQGDLEERFVTVFSELAHSGNIIVYIPNIENIFGGGGLNMDISGALVEYLNSSRIKIIGSTTENAYKEYISQKLEIKELFDVVEMREPDEESSLFMVMEKAKELELLNRVRISYEAVKEVCALANSYETEGIAMPGSAVHLLDDTIAYCLTHGIKHISKKNVQWYVEEKKHIVLDEPTEEESQKLLKLEEQIHNDIVSQNEAVTAISNAMRRVRTGMKNDKRPIASFLFLGPTGVGKTQTAKALAKAYFGNEEIMIRLDMSEYQQPDSVDRFLGRPGVYDETVLDKVARSPFSLLLLDEFEKAYPHILDLFLQILDEGRLTDNAGRTVSFANCIIIATSNAGSEFIREADNDGALSENLKNALIEKVQESGTFKPELINRFDDVIVFKPLTEADVSNISKLLLKNVIDEAAKKQITLSHDEAVPEYIAKHAYSIEFGARNIKRFIEQSVENQLSKLILSNTLTHGGSASIVIENNTLVIKV